MGRTDPRSIVVEILPPESLRGGRDASFLPDGHEPGGENMADKP
jgi:hypothetical protein